MSDVAELPFDQLLARAEKLTQAFETHPNSAVREDVFELLQTIDRIHREAILSLVDLVVESGTRELIARAAEDPKVQALLLMYDVLPLPEQLRWQEALDSVRPALQSRNAGVELIQVADQMPHLRLKGAFADAEEPELREIVQQAIIAVFGENQSIKWEPRERPPAPDAFVPVEEIQPARREISIDLGLTAQLQPGEMRACEAEGLTLLVCRTASGFHAFPNACPGSALPLHLGRLAGETLVCPWHGCEFDVRTGKRAFASGQDLQPLTLRVQGEQVQLVVWR